MGFCFYWSIGDLQCYVNFCFRAKWFSYTYIYILFNILFHYTLSQDIEYSFLCYSVGPCCLSILYIIVCIKKVLLSILCHQELATHRAENESKRSQKISLKGKPTKIKYWKENQLKSSKEDMSELWLKMRQHHFPFEGHFSTQDAQWPASQGAHWGSLPQSGQPPWAEVQKALSHQPCTHCARTLLPIRD